VKTFELHTCPACGGERAASFALGTEHELRRCADCELVFAPAYADPAEIYVEGYLRGETEFGLDVMHPLFQEFLTYAANRRLDLIQRVSRPPGRFLDVGCGTGEVLAAARERGWEVQGAEPVEESAAYAMIERGLDVRAAILQESGLPEHSYDVVTAFHVLEHMTDGRGFLEMLSQWARPGGRVVIEVPNWQSMHRRAYGAEWPGLRPLEHVAHYTPKTLAATLRSVGLEVEAVHTPGFLWRRQTLDQMLGDLGIARLGRWMQRARVMTRPCVQDGHQYVTTNEVGWWTVNALQSAYAASRTGLVVLAIARVAER
jgi:2-polyprenyl-3-methyl-5-hydroxy-6-metoxy-1,4-benzoquinol methylase